MLTNLLEEFHFLAGFLVHLGCACDLGNAALQHFQISKDQFQVDGLNIAQRIDTAVDVNDIFILKTAHDMDDGIHLADIGQELIAKSFALGSALNQPCDIDKFDNSRRNLFGMVHLAKQTDPFIRDCHHAHIGVDGAEGIVCRLCASFGQRVEKCAF